MATLKKIIGIASAIAIPSALVWLALKASEATGKIENGYEKEPESETSVESENESNGYCRTDKSAVLVETGHKWWTRNPDGNAKLHSVKIGTIGTLSQTDLDEFSNMLECGDRAEDIVTTAVAMLINKGYKVVSLHVYDSID